MPLLDQFQWFTDVVPAANAEFVQNIEREQMVTTQCIFRHDWTVTTFCYNVYCIV